ncbi:uncharacterized protein LOC111288802 [Durio zibethinus]|uniref:Uncharacterized protein LOC111288802 n=1 Tax=Durio zibethinus TaxID=66656 RepID=A0A6P5Y4Z4_DURZI|nr:uncharacterized protein LOC111288802 [Durio zibethinus]
MEEREEPKPPKINLKGKKLSVRAINLEEIKRHPTVHVSPRGTGNSTKPSGARWNCLCSPTTHAGSFRCRHHRLAGMTRGGSVGSKLSFLANSKSEPISDSLQAQ